MVYSGHQHGDLKDRLVALNAVEETGMKNACEQFLQQGEMTTEEIIEMCETFMQQYQPGQRIFPVLPAYINELKARIHASAT